MSEKCCNNSDNFLTSRRTNGGKNECMYKTIVLKNEEQLAYVRTDVCTARYYHGKQFLSQCIDLNEIGPPRYEHPYVCEANWHKNSCLMWFSLCE